MDPAREVAIYIARIIFKAASVNAKVDEKRFTKCILVIPMHVLSVLSFNDNLGVRGRRESTINLEVKDVLVLALPLPQKRNARFELTQTSDKRRSN